MLEVKNLNFTKNKSAILKNISLVCNFGKITTLIGKSGAGKTSLLKCIAQLDTAYSGIVEIDKRNIKDMPKDKRAEIIGLVFQQFNLFPHLTILENCTQPLEVVKGYDKSKALEIAHNMLNNFGLIDLENSYPINVSGGQQQRVAIVRTLCFNPKVICLDEPTSALDPENTKILMDMLKNLANNGTTVILSSQDMPFVKAIADHVILLENGVIIEQYDSKTNEACGEKIRGFLSC